MNSAMVTLWTNCILTEKKTYEEVPALLQEAVKAQLTAMDRLDLLESKK